MADAPVVAPDDDLGVTVVLRNTGPRTGREIVQAYLEPPTADPGRPVRVLAAFAAVTAAPGEHAEARLTVPARAFSRYDEAAGTGGSARRASSPSASADHRPTCLFTCGLSHFDAERAGLAAPAHCVPAALVRDLCRRSRGGGP